MIRHHRPQAATQKGFYRGLRGEDPALGTSGSFSPDWWNLGQIHPSECWNSSTVIALGGGSRGAPTSPWLGFVSSRALLLLSTIRFRHLKAQVVVEVIYGLEDVFPQHTLTRKSWG